MVLGVDVGGTFTDAVLVLPGDTAGSAPAVFADKTPTTPHDQSEGAIVAALEALDAGGASAASVDRFVHGMTVTTNAMLEGDFARTALLATKGFTDIEELARQNRPSLYRLCEPPPRPIVPRELRFAVDERCTPAGTLRSLDEAALDLVIEQLADSEVEAVAVCLLFSFLHPRHELRVGELLARRLPQMHVALSHQVVGTFREYERCATTVAAAALAPKLGAYMARLCERATTAGLPEPQVMLSNGGTCAASEAARRAAHTVLSGPAGGAVGAAIQAIEDPLLVGFDMGGTSTDVSVAERGAVRVRSSRRVAGRPLALPAVDIATVGAGGGSIAWSDEGGALRVGPRSAGARPGPAAYGHGGQEPTVTDANLLLGYLGANGGLAGGLRLDRVAAERAVQALADRLGIALTDTAAGIVEVANLEMTRATTAMTVARGIDPRGHTLVAFGGAGPMHAARVAERLGIARVHCPAACGVLSALGLALAGRRNDVSRSVVAPFADFGRERFAQLAAELSARARAQLADARRDVYDERTCELRYRGQSFELPVMAAAGDDPRLLIDRFHTAHEREFGWHEPDGVVELVTLRASALTPRGELPAGHRHAESEPVRDTRRAWFDGAWHDATVLRVTTSEPLAELSAGGPAIVELAQATVVVPPGWRVVTFGGGLMLESATAQGADG